MSMTLHFQENERNQRVNGYEKKWVNGLTVGLDWVDAMLKSFMRVIYRFKGL